MSTIDHKPVLHHRRQGRSELPPVFDEFRQWMNNLAVPIREVRQDLAIRRVIEPLCDGFETAWMEVGWQDFLIADKEEDLVKLMPSLALDSRKVDAARLD
jgi:hypothetical protein